MDEATLKDICLTPEKFYETPKDVAVDDRWSSDQKQEILQAWKLNEEALLRASNEGMDGGERPHLQLVVDELEKLKAD